MGLTVFLIVVSIVVAAFILKDGGTYLVYRRKVPTAYGMTFRYEYEILLDCRESFIDAHFLRRKGYVLYKADVTESEAKDFLSQTGVNNQCQKK